MTSGPDLDPYRPTPPADAQTIARRIARTLGVLAGLAISLYGFALYGLRCFDTCPTDPAEDKVGQLLTASIFLTGIVVLTAAAFTGTRWSRGGSSVIVVLGSVIALCGVAAVALVPAIDAPGDHSGPTTFGILALIAGGASAGTAWALRRRGRPVSRPHD